MSERTLPPAADAVRQRWKQVATATGDSDTAAAEGAVAAFYEAFGATQPERVVWADSPHQLAQMGIERKEGAHPHPSAHLFAERDHRIVRDWNAAESAFHRIGFRGHHANDHSPLREVKAWSNIASRLSREFEEGEWHRLDDLIFTWHTVRDIPDHGWEEQLPNDFLRAAYIFDLAQDFAGLTLSDYTRAAVALARETAGWWIAGTKTAFLCRHPEIFKIDRDGQLHCPDGPAARWRDGTAIYTHHGARYPAIAIEDPAAMTLETVLSEQDHDVRRQLVFRYPLERFLTEAKADRKLTVLDDNKRYGKLLSVAVPIDPEQAARMQSAELAWRQVRIYLPSPPARTLQRRLTPVHIDDFGQWPTSKRAFGLLDERLGHGPAVWLRRLMRWRPGEPW